MRTGGEVQFVRCSWHWYCRSLSLARRLTKAAIRDCWEISYRRSMRRYKRKNSGMELLICDLLLYNCSLREDRALALHLFADIPPSELRAAGRIWCRELLVIDPAIEQNSPDASHPKSHNCHK